MGIGPFIGSSVGGVLAENLGLIDSYRILGLVPMIVSLFVFLFLRKYERAS
jgi:PPP family 3-phenylpropionic acid transporter